MLNEVNRLTNTDDNIVDAMSYLISLADMARAREARTNGFQDGDLKDEPEYSAKEMQEQINELERETGYLEGVRDMKINQEDIEDNYNNGYLDGVNDTHTIANNGLTSNQLIEKIVNTRLREPRLLDDVSIRVLKGLTEIQLMRNSSTNGIPLERKALEKAKIAKEEAILNAGDDFEEHS